MFGLEYGTLAVYKSVAKSVQFLSRDKNLSFKHHSAVAKLPPDEQRRWLSEAAPESPDKPPRLTSSKLRKAIQDENNCSGQILIAQ